MKELSLFTGMGGGIYGGLILGWETVAYVEQDQYCQKVIKQRIADGWFHSGNIYGDIQEFNKNHAKQYTGKIDILTGGFPCQPFSVAGKREGTSDDRWLFDEIIKTIKIVQPRRLLFENVPGILTSNAIIKIYESLVKIGYRPKAPLVLGSADCGNIHKRERVWIFADSKEFRSGRRTSQQRDYERTVSQQTEQEGATLWCEAEGCSIRKVHDTHTKSQSIDGAKSEITKHQEQQKPQLGNGDVKLTSTNPTSHRCDDRSDNWQERQVCKDGFRNIQEDQSERYERITRVDSNVDDVDITNTEQRRRAQVLRDKETTGSDQTSERSAIEFDSQTVTSTRRNQKYQSIKDLVDDISVPEPLLCRMANEFPNIKQQLKAIGNGQDPVVMATAWCILSGEQL